MIRLKTLSSRFITLCLLAVIPALGLLVVLYSIDQTHHLQLENVRNSLAQEVATIAVAHDEIIAETRNTFVGLSQHLAHLEPETGRCNQALSDALRDARGYDVFLVAAPNGDVVCAPWPLDKSINLADRSYFQKAMNTRAFAVGQYIIGRVSGKAVLPMAEPILDANGDVRILLIAGRTLEWLRGVIARQHQDALSIVSVVDQRGTILARFPEAEGLVGQPFSSKEVRQKIPHQSRGIVVSESNGSSHTYAFSRLSQTVPNVFVVADASSAVLTAAINKLYRRNMAIAVGLTALIVAILWYFSQRLVFIPMRSLLTTIRQMQAGDLRARSDTELGIGEVAEVLDAFNHMAEALEGRTRQLEHSQRLEVVGKLTGGLAHDFNNILGVIIGNLDLLADHLESDPEGKQLVTSALHAGERGAQLNKRLLAFARRQALQLERVDVNEQLSQMMPMLQRTLGEGVQVNFFPGQGVWTVEVDPTQLEAAIMNLAVNARDAMQARGTLTLETENRHLDSAYVAEHEELEPGDYVMISVADDGRGMSREILNRVFEPFYTTKGVGEGSGLGLSMVHGFAKQSEGHVNIYSEPNRGTTVRLYLPRSGKQRPGVATPAETPKHTMRQAVKETVLLVEDQSDVLEMLSRLLHDLGYKVVESSNADQALDMLNEMGGAIDIVITDVVMPGRLDGIELAETVRARYPSLPVVLTSGFTERSLVKRRLASDELTVPLLTKPYRKAELDHVIRGVLDGE